MKDISKKRPKSFFVIGWGYLLISFLITLHGVIVWIILFNVIAQEKSLFSPKTNPFEVRFIPLIQIIIGISILIVSINFLKLRKWTRATLEGITWVGLLGITVGVIYSNVKWGENIYTYMFLVPFFISLKKLRNKEIRSIFCVIKEEG